MNARQKELTARDLLADQSQIDVCWRQRRWVELAALVRFARRDAPVELAQTDPALYRQLREQITRFFLCGGDAFSLKKLKAQASRTTYARERKKGVGTSAARRGQTSGENQCLDKNAKF